MGGTGVPMSLISDWLGVKSLISDMGGGGGGKISDL